MMLVSFRNQLQYQLEIFYSNVSTVKYMYFYSSVIFISITDVTLYYPTLACEQHRAPCPVPYREGFL